ncbi:MAG: hypothetical protein EOO85_31595 [Pedobacter sp.]|nr:MAG: hypothetical protein EOO85_31595 [Pedobacter sp.]
MRKILLTPLLALTISGCSMFRQPVVMVSSAIDYSEYLKQDMFLSESNAVSFQYQPVASVSVVQLSGYEVKQSGQRAYNDDAYQSSQSHVVTTTTNKYIYASKEEVLKQLVKEAKSKNANAIINLEIKPVIVTTPKGYSYLQGYSATGMAIKK